MEGVNPIVIMLMFVARCLVPLLIMLGISYLLRRLGLIKDPPQPPEDIQPNGYSQKEEKGGWMHGKA